MKDVDFWNKYPILILLLLIVLRSIYGRNQCFVYSKALIPNEYVMIIAAFNQKLQPIFAPGTFLKRNLKLPNKICPAMGIESLPNIGTDVGSGTYKLIGQYGHFLILLHFEGKSLGNTLAPFVPYLFTIRY